MTPTKGFNLHDVDPGHFTPDHVELAHGEIETLKRLKSAPHPACLQCASFFKSMTRNPAVFRRLGEICLEAIHQAILRSQPGRQRMRNDNYSYDTLRKYACDLSKAKRLTDVRLIELQNLCAGLHANLPLIVNGDTLEIILEAPKAA